MTSIPEARRGVIPPERITKGVPSFLLLKPSSVDKLAKVPDYPLDYNIYIFKQIKGARDKLTTEELLDVIQAFKLKDLNDGQNGKSLTKTSRMHDRLLMYLMLERKRREKIVFKKYLNDGINKQKNPSAPQTTLQYDLQLLPKEEADILNYNIKSPIFNFLSTSFISVQKDSEATTNYKKLAVVQNIEYNFEEELDDDELIELFADCPEFKNFAIIYNDLRKTNAETNSNILLQPQERQDGDTKSQSSNEIQKIVDQLLSENIIRIMIPLAGQAVLSGIDLTRGQAKQVSRS